VQLLGSNAAFSPAQTPMTGRCASREAMSRFSNVSPAVVEVARERTEAVELREKPLVYRCVASLLTYPSLRRSVARSPCVSMKHAIAESPGCRPRAQRPALPTYLVRLRPLSRHR
jgi:hypothetical protein